MRDVLPFVSLMNLIEFILKIQGDTLPVLCSHFENLVTVYEDNQGANAIAVSPQILPHTKHITIKYHNFWSFVAYFYVEIKHVNTKE